MSSEGRQQWTGFPSMRDHATWPGAWCWGVDFAAESGALRVIAVRLGDGDIKYGTDWVGPVQLEEATAAALERWAQQVLNQSGGYVHLFPADGDEGTNWLLQWDAAEQEDDDK